MTDDSSRPEISGDAPRDPQVSETTRQTGSPTGGPTVSVDRAKQGRMGAHMAVVLAISLFAVIAAFAAIYLTHAHQATDTTQADAAQRAAEGQRTTR